MYTSTALYYDAIYAWKDYAAESAAVTGLIKRMNPWSRTLLDVACGTGRHLAHLRAEFAVEGVDLDPALLAIARTRLPGITVHEGDMRTFALDRTFDAVTVLFSSIAYVGTVEALDETTANLARHTAPGGLVLVEPWILPEDYRYDTIHATFVDEPELKIARMNTAGPPGPVNVLEFHYLIGTPAGVETVTERHEVGQFTHDDYAGSMSRAGLTPHHDPEGPMGRGMYIGVKPR